LCLCFVQWQEQRGRHFFSPPNPWDIFNRRSTNWMCRIIPDVLHYYNWFQIFTRLFVDVNFVVGSCAMPDVNDVADVSEVLTASIIESKHVRWVVLLACHLLLLVSCLVYLSSLKIEAICSSETSNFLRTTRRYNLLTSSKIFWKKRKLVIKACGGRGGVAPHILDLGSNWRWMDEWSVTRPCRFAFRENCPRYHLYRRQGGLWVRSGRCGEEKKLTHVRNRTSTIQPIARRYTNWAILGLLNDVLDKVNKKVVILAAKS
jgi:hypothetical protein